MSGIGRLTIATWNIQTISGNVRWPQRRQFIWQTLADLDADFIGLQEAMPPQVNQTAMWLRQHGSYGMIGLGRKPDPRAADDLARIHPDDPEAANGDEFSPLIYRTDRYRYEPLQGQGYDAARIRNPCDAQTIWLHSDPALRHTPGVMMPGTHYPRIFTWGRFRSVASGDVLYVYNTHVDHQSVSARLAAAEQITQHMASLEEVLPPILLMGDLNAPAEAREVQAYAAPLVRACANEWTWQALEGDKPPVQLDHIFCSRHFSLRETRVLRPRGPQQQRYSDHDPLLASFELQMRRG